MKTISMGVVDPEVFAQGEFGIEEDIHNLGIRARYNDQPIPLLLKKVFEDFGFPLPGDEVQRVDINKIYEEYNLWLIPHSVGIIRDRGHRDVTAVGIDVEFVKGRTTCSTVSLIPTPHFVINSEIHAILGVTGDIQTCDVTEFMPEAVKEWLGLKFMFSSKLRMGLRLNAKVITPYIAAIGRGGNYAYWRFDKYDQALFGRDIEAWSIIALPKSQKQIKFKVRYYYETKLFLIPRRVESEWQEITCPLLQ